MRTIVEAARVVGIQPTMCDYDSLRGVIGDKEERRGEKRERERRATKHGEKQDLLLLRLLDRIERFSSNNER
jgi:hypothetical protein